MVNNLFIFSYAVIPYMLLLFRLCHYNCISVGLMISACDSCRECPQLYYTMECWWLCSLPPTVTENMECNNRLIKIGQLEGLQGGFQTILNQPTLRTFSNHPSPTLKVACRLKSDWICRCAFGSRCLPSSFLSLLLLSHGS